MTKRIGFLLVCLLLFAACKSDKKSALPLSFEPKVFTEKANDTCELREFNCTIIQLEVLEAFGDEEAAKKINQSLREHLVLAVSTEESPEIRSPEQMAKDFVAQQKKVAEEYDSDFPWYALVNQSIYFQSDSLISIGVDTEVMTGGAHGYAATSFFNFDPQTGDEYDHDDLFKEGFTAYVERIFRQQEEIATDSLINSTGYWFEDDQFHLPINIGFEEDKVILVYNPYEIASYADGEFYLELPKNEVSEYLKLKIE